MPSPVFTQVISTEFDVHLGRPIEGLFQSIFAGLDEFDISVACPFDTMLDKVPSCEITHSLAHKLSVSTPVKNVLRNASLNVMLHFDLPDILTVSRDFGLARPRDQLSISTCLVTLRCVQTYHTLPELF